MSSNAHCLRPSEASLALPRHLRTSFESFRIAAMLAVILGEAIMFRRFALMVDAFAVAGEVKLNASRRQKS